MCESASNSVKQVHSRQLCRCKVAGISVSGTSRDQKGRVCCCRCSKLAGVGGTEGKQRWGGGNPGDRVDDEVEDDAAMRENFGDGHRQEECEKG